jgi:hypothetical protein
MNPTHYGHLVLTAVIAAQFLGDGGAADGPSRVPHLSSFPPEQLPRPHQRPPHVIDDGDIGQLFVG